MPNSLRMGVLKKLEKARKEGREEMIFENLKFLIANNVPKEILVNYINKYKLENATISKAISQINEETSS